MLRRTKKNLTRNLHNPPQNNKIRLRANGRDQSSSLEVGYALIENILKYYVPNYMIIG